MTEIEIEPKAESRIEPMAAAYIRPQPVRPEELTLDLPDDHHVHFREVGAVQDELVAQHAPYFGRARFMPNTREPIETGPQAVAYAAALVRRRQHAYRFEPQLTIMLTDRTTPETIREAAACGVTAAKLYFKGVTTNSAHGVSDPLGRQTLAAYAAMQDHGLVLCGHFEDPKADILSRELLALPVASAIVRRFPELRVSVEHVTMAETVDWIMGQRPGVVGTITAHHLVCTINDLIGVQGLADPHLVDGGPRLLGGLPGPAIRPHYYGLPVPKTFGDRSALLDIATSGHRKFCFGSDSAFHDSSAKECACGCAGIYMPGKVGLSVLAWVFEGWGPPDWAESLRRFTGRNGADFYGLAYSTGSITLRRRPWLVPETMGAGMVPFAAGFELPWEALPYE